MRVVAGKSRGRRLASFKGLSIRPTSDKVRGAVFNILGVSSEFAERFKKVLDLFAGTGAMGIEALSRGAVSAVFVDKDPKAVSVIKKNLELCNASGAGAVLRQDVMTALKGLSDDGERFDLIFIDPPYDSTLTSDALTATDKAGLLNPGGRVVAETSRRIPLLLDVKALKLTDERRYGDTLVYFFTSRAG